MTELAFKLSLYSYRLFLWLVQLGILISFRADYKDGDQITAPIKYESEEVEKAEWKTAYQITLT